MKYERFQFISDLFYLRLNYFESCQDMGNRPLPIVFVLNGYDHDTADKEKVFKVADKLIEIGCDVNGYDEMGLTPLQMSLVPLLGSPSVVEFLLQRGADPYKEAIDGSYTLLETYSVKKYTGMNAFDLAQKEKTTLENKANRKDSYKKVLQIIELLNASSRKNYSLERALNKWRLLALS
jgi:ankyrin repeat protein